VQRVEATWARDVRQIFGSPVVGCCGSSAGVHVDANVGQHPQRAPKRHATSSLDAAGLVSCEVHGSLHKRNHPIEFHKFRQRFDREVPTRLDVHLVLDSSSTQTTPKVKHWLATHPVCAAPDRRRP
jgi:hypothetical protein